MPHRLRKCSVCGKYLSEGNPSPNLCFAHQMTPKEKEVAADFESVMRANQCLCSSRDMRPFNMVMFGYNGSRKDL